MVYTPWKALKMPFYATRYWSRNEYIHIPVFITALSFITFQIARMAVVDEEGRRAQYHNGYPTAWDPLREKEQAFYSMYFKQNNINIFDPMFTGVDGDELEKQLKNSAA
eukprot:TRINITY_DN514_c2_g1_i2.p2 TRINITY_DN514_c2_g1~~TRINITY_DN514_c2_g1_i2.p2  ORF type:complete len:109 (+),score=23.38 TRINITY_DN514_c2_g1_i2:82-408(+)